MSTTLNKNGRPRKWSSLADLEKRLAEIPGMTELIEKERARLKQEEEKREHEREEAKRKRASQD